VAQREALVASSSVLRVLPVSSPAVRVPSIPRVPLRAAIPLVVLVHVPASVRVLVALPVRVRVVLVVPVPVVRLVLRRRLRLGVRSALLPVAVAVGSSSIPRRRKAL
jgi:hypothetical protein